MCPMKEGVGSSVIAAPPLPRRQLGFISQLPKCLELFPKGCCFADIIFYVIFL